jgi:serine O-acetyltransferase
MKFSIDLDDLNSLVLNQINVFYNDGHLIKNNELIIYQKEAINRLEKAFIHIRKPYFFVNNECFFDHLHSDHYAMYLYLLSNTIWENNGDIRLASKIFLLNKALHGIDAFYKIKLPEIFIFAHPLGTILGNAKYSNYFAVFHNCTVGGTDDGKYPKFNGEVILYSGSSVIGDCIVGSNTIFGANSSIINTKIDSDQVVLNRFPNNRIIENNRSVIELFHEGNFL